MVTKRQIYGFSILVLYKSLTPIQFKDTPFLVRRYDNDVLVMPMKYLNELSRIPNKKFDSKAAAVGVGLSSVLHHSSFSLPTAQY